MSGTGQSIEQSLASLRRIRRQRARRSHPCELCGAELPAEHEHLLDLGNRHLACACSACAILLSDGNAHFCRVPRRAEPLADFRLSDAQWEALLIPIELAFFFENSRAGRPMAMYPSPAGPTESLLELTTWQELVAENPDRRPRCARRRSLAGQSRPRHPGVLLRVDRSLLRAGRTDPAALARAVGRDRSLAAHRQFLRRPQAGQREHGSCLI